MRLRETRSFLILCELIFEQAIRVLSQFLNQCAQFENGRVEFPQREPGNCCRLIAQLKCGVCALVL